jgi:hypothetical protein
MAGLSLLVELRGMNSADSVESATVRFQLESDDLTTVGDPQVWTSSDKPDDVLLRFRDDLERTSQWPGDDQFSQLSLLPKVVSTLGRVSDLHSGSEAAVNVRSIIQFVGPYWVVTGSGLAYLPDLEIRANHQELQEYSNRLNPLERLRTELAERGFSDDDLDAAFGTARLIHRHLKLGERF